MHADFRIDLPVVFAFLLVLARVTGIVLFVPIPGMQSGPDAARIVLSLALSFVLMPAWPSPAVDAAWQGKLPMWIASEFTFGLLVGVCVAFLLEGFQVAAQMIGLQAGYSFASTVDPNTQADAAVLQIIAQLFAGSLFFAMGLDREIVRVLSGSLQRVPAIASLASAPVSDAVVKLGSQMFIVGLRLALPVIALMILLDISFAIVGKVHVQFHIMSLAFPAKMLAGLGLLATTLALFPKIGQLSAEHTFGMLIRMLGR